MNKPRISAIAAIGKNRALGKDNGLLWSIPDDMKRVRSLTVNHPIIMGRKTFESKEIKGKPLPKRTNIIITRDPQYQAEGCLVVTSIEDAITEAAKVEQEEMFIFGGAQIYALALPYTERLYLTVVDEEPEAQAFFPDYSEFKKILNEQHGEVNGLTYTFFDLER